MVTVTPLAILNPVNSSAPMFGLVAFRELSSISVEIPLIETPAPKHGEVYSICKSEELINSGASRIESSS